MDKAESMRHLASLPPWWEFAVDYAVYVYSRTPMRCINWQTPYELMDGQKPDIKYLRVLGCAAWVWLPEEKRLNKLSPKSELMIFLGFDTSVKGFKFMRMHNNTIFMGTTAQFIEDYFPRKDHINARDPGLPTEDSGEKPLTLPEDPNKGEDDRSDDGHDSQPPAPSPPDSDHQIIRRSTRERRSINKPDNVYGDRNPTEIDRNVDKNRFWKDVIESEKASNQTDSQDPSAENNQDAGPNSAPDNHSDNLDQHEDLSEDDLNRIVREGGEALVNLLLMRAKYYNQPVPQQF